MDNARRLLERTLESLGWMITDMQVRFDDTGINPGAYSEELLEAMDLQYDIKAELNK